MMSKEQLLYDTRNVNKSCDILSINYKHPITLTDKFEDFNGTSVEQKYTWNSPAAYIYSSLLHYMENKISLNNYEPDTLADIHKQLIEKEIIYKTENILNDVISEKLKDDENFKNQLRETGNKKIIYKSPNNLIGTGIDGKGKNLLGKCYMKQRNVLQIEQQKSEKTDLIEFAKKIINEINNYYNNAVNVLRNYKELFNPDINFENIQDVEELIVFIEESANKLETKVTIDNYDIVYNEYMNNTLPYGVNNIINSVEIEDLKTFDNLQNFVNFNNYKKKIIKIVLKEHIGEYVNSITDIRNREIMDKYVNFIISDKFTATGPNNKSLNEEVRAKITQDIAKEQSLIFNEDGDICTKKIPQRLVELYKNYRKDLKDNNETKSFIKFNQEVMQNIMTEFKRYNPSETIVSSIMDFSVEDNDITLLEKILSYVNQQSDELSEDQYEINTGNIFSPTYRDLDNRIFLVHINGKPKEYPDITSYYFVEMLKFINNATNSEDFYDLIKSETDGYKSPVELSKLFDKNYAEITQEKLAKALVRILNVKFTCCSISCAALDALLDLPKNATIIWGSSNTILGMNNKKEGENLVGKYLSQIRASFEYRKRTALTSKSSASDKIKNALSDKSKRKLFMNCVNKFNYQLNLYAEFKTIFDVDNQELSDHDVNCCKKFMMLLFSNCDILHLIANNHINVIKIKEEIIKLSTGEIFPKNCPTALIQWFWGFFILIASNVSDEIVEVIINKDNQNKTNENFKTQPEEYIKNFVLTIISVLYYFINVYVNRTDNDKYIEFSYDKIIQFIKVIIFNNKDQVLDENFSKTLDNTYLNNFCESCKECVGIIVDDASKEQFNLLLNTIKVKSESIPKIENLIVYFNNPQFIFNRNINTPINA